MNNIIIQDDMRKEGNMWKYLMIFSFIMAALSFVVLIWIENGVGDYIRNGIMFMLFGCYGLYGFLYAYKYKLTVTNEKIVLKTLFRSIEMQLKDIGTYTCKRYMKSKFYQFSIFCNNKKAVMISTRYKDEFENLLKETTENKKDESFNL